MSKKNREAKIIAAVACPTCRTAISRACRVDRGRPMVCPARREAWQQWRATQTPDYVITDRARVDRQGNWYRIAPQSVEARTALDRLRGQTGTWDAALGVLVVAEPEMRALVRQLIDQGWITGETI